MKSNSARLRRMILAEVENLERTERDILEFLEEIGEDHPKRLELNGAAAYLAQFYSGVESILKQIVRYHEVIIPASEGWHVELLKMFREESGFKDLPVFDDELQNVLMNYLRVRHVVRNSYGFQLKWERLKPALDHYSSTVSRLKTVFEEYLKTI